MEDFTHGGELPYQIGILFYGRFFLCNLPLQFSQILCYNKKRNFLGRIKTKVLDEFQVCWIFHKFKENSTNRGSVLATCSPGLV